MPKSIRTRHVIQQLLASHPSATLTWLNVQYGPVAANEILQQCGYTAADAEAIIG